MPIIFYISYIALWLLFMVIAVLLLLVYRHFGLMALGSVEGVQRDGLRIGEKAPTIDAVNADGKDIAWTVQSGRMHLLVFVSVDCEPCAKILPFIAQLALMISGLNVVLMVAGGAENLLRLTDKFQLSPTILCLADDGRGTSENYRVRVTPFAFVIGADQQVLAKGLCDNPKRLQAMLTSGGIDSPEVLEVTSVPSR